MTNKGIGLDLTIVILESIVGIGSHCWLHVDPVNTLTSFRENF